MLQYSATSLIICSDRSSAVFLLYPVFGADMRMAADRGGDKTGKTPGNGETRDVDVIYKKFRRKKNLWQNGFISLRKAALQ